MKKPSDTNCIRTDCLAYDTARNRCRVGYDKHGICDRLLTRKDVANGQAGAFKRTPQGQAEIPVPVHGLDAVEDSGTTLLEKKA